MSLLRTIRLRLRRIFRPDDVDRELDDELRFHIEMQMEANLRAGMSPEEARRQAAILFGGVEGHKEESRRRRGPGILAARISWLDLKLGFRMLRKYPGLTVVGGLAIAVATGLGSAFFEVTEDMFNHRLPLEEGDRIVVIRNWDLARASQEPRSLHDFVRWHGEVRSIEDLSAFVPFAYGLVTEAGNSASADAAQFTASAFALTRVPPLLGRPLLETDERRSF